MQKERIAQLENYLLESPEDPFLRYALATEYRATDRAKAWEYFSQILENHPEYAPVYYHAANMAWEDANIEQAKHLFEQGIQRCTEQQEAHLLKELRQQYQLFLAAEFEEE